VPHNPDCPYNPVYDLPAASVGDELRTPWRAERGHILDCNGDDVFCDPVAMEYLCAAVNTHAGLVAWKDSVMPLLLEYDSIAESVGGQVGSSKVKNLKRFVLNAQRRINAGLNTLIKKESK
jgi:hypothetical protein